MSFHFNFYDIDFLQNKRKILEDDGVRQPTIIDNFNIKDNFLVANWKKRR